MKTIERFVLVAKKRMGVSEKSSDPVRVTPQADMLAEAVDLQIEAMRSHFEREMEQLERRLTQARKPDTADSRFDPE